MTLQSVVGLALALAAILLLGRDLRRAWRNPLRRPITLLVAGLVAVLLVGTLAGRAHPSPWWLVLPAALLIWEVARGWRQTPRCHVWEAGIGAFAASLLLAAVGLGLSPAEMASALLPAAGLAGVIGLGLLWKSRRSEPRPWRADDPIHYERRRSERG
jgi:hypothetical protein